MDKKTSQFNLFCGETKMEALVSECGLYRYSLSRVWDSKKDKVMFVMLNPSKADETTDDNTTRRVVQFAKDWGFGGVLIGNLFPYRATKPKELYTASNVIGDANIGHLSRMSKNAAQIIYAWGNSNTVKRLLQRHPDYKPLAAIKSEAYYLELSMDGTPKHPLFLRKNLTPIKYEVNPASLLSNL